jgi:tRNA-Thr(GGU) m(6)t(6)A37 methyltransferase TsaA
MHYTFKPIGFIRSPYKEKFGTPRQPFLVNTGYATLELLPPYNHADAVRGLAAFSHLWISFIFHQTPRSTALLVRPPRLGGNTRVGVFATRSPYRPNPLGLSLVRLTDISTAAGVTLTLTGGDLVDGTPVIDIKPYLAFVESHPNASSGFVDAPPTKLAVLWTPNAIQSLHSLSHSPSEDAQFIEDVLACDPRPAYHEDANRCYGMTLIRYTVQFRIDNNRVEILEIFLCSPNY